MHRWAFIGTGDISRGLAPDLQAVAPGAITAVWGRTPERARGFAAEYCIPFASDSLDEVFSLETVDIVLDLSATVSGDHGWITLDPMFWAGTRARIHAGSVERIFVAPEIIEHPRAGNGYRPMLAAVESALDDGLLEHPWHGRDDTVSVARTMEAVLGNMVDKQMAGGSSGRDVGQS